MDKQTEYQKEFQMWLGLFTKTTLETQKAAEGLIQKVAYIHSLYCEWRPCVWRNSFAVKKEMSKLGVGAISH